MKRSPSYWLPLVAGLLASWSCQTPAPKPEPVAAEAVKEQKRPLSPAGKLYFEDPGCAHPYSVWQTVLGFDENDKPVGSKSIWATPGRVIRVQTEGAPLMRRMLERDGQFFEEFFTFGTYTQPFRSIRLSSSQPSYSSTLRLNFDDKPLPVGSALAVGQLFRTGGNESTRVVLSLPPEQKAEDVFEWIQTAAAEKRIDHNAPLKITAEGAMITLENTGPRGSSSGFGIFQLKQPLQKLEVRILSDRKWPSGSADAVELAFAEKQCLAEAECQGIKRVLSFEPGKGTSASGQDLNALTQQLQTNFAQGKTQALSLGRGGVIEFELDGVALNHDGPDFRLEASEHPNACPNPAQKVKVYAKAKAEQLWQSIDGSKGVCFSAGVDLQLVPLARYVRLEDISSGKTPAGYQLVSLACSRKGPASHEPATQPKAP